MNRTLLKGPWCRREVIRSFPSISNPSIPRRTFLSHPVYNVNDRAFSSVFHLRSEKSSFSSQPSNSVTKDEAEAPLQNDSPTPSQHIPWYLQEKTPMTDSQPMLSRDQIPDLPEEPPEILPVLLDYVFKDLGLDELKLIDLRGLDTPPALGANVIMIIGTARSVKHLNVSADRLCRWLRSTWKLRPYADGLLGRNELKIKLRRKARRARIASRAGAMVDEKDDGITTGWICVNAGVVEESPVLEEADRSFEGFGQVVGGTRIVVQIFTEEKRAEVDLDGFWQATLERAERKKEKFAKEISDVPPEEVRVSTSKSPSSSDREFEHIPRTSVSLPFKQRRSLHNSRRLEILNPNGDINTSPGDLAAQSPASQITDPARNDPLTAGVSTDSLFQHLSGLSDDQILSELGDGPDDRESTLFLRLFYNGLSKSSAEETGVAQLKLTCTAISRKHPAYSKESLWRAFMSCNANFYSLSDELCFHIVSAFLTERPADDQSVKPWLPDSDKELALLVLEHLSVQGVDVLNMKVFNMLYNAAFHARDPSLADRYKIRKDSDGVDPASRVLRLIETLDIPFDSEQMRNHMVSRFRNGDYDGFWKLWRKLPLNGSLRSAADYELLFQLHAELGDELRARDCVSTWVPMMSREDPPIPLQGQLLQYIMYCLVIAAPGIEHAAAEGSTSNLALIWNQCKSKMPMGA